MVWQSNYTSSAGVKITLANLHAFLTAAIRLVTLQDWSYETKENPLRAETKWNAELLMLAHDASIGLMGSSRQI